MRFVPETSSLARWLVLPMGVLAVAGLAALRFAPDTVLSLVHCPLRDMTGLACPTCGGTSAAIEFATGRWSDAWTANPLVPAGALLLLAWLLWALLAVGVPALRVRLRLGPTEAKAARILAALLIVALWVRQALVLG